MQNLNVWLDNPFPQWIYANESPLYVLNECDDADTDDNKYIASPVQFTAQEMADINECLDNTKTIDNDENANITNRIILFDKFFNCPVITCVVNGEYVKYAAETGNIGLLDRINTHNNELYQENIDDIYKYGSISIIEYARNNNPAIFNDKINLAFTHAIQRGDLSCIVWLFVHDNMLCYNGTYACDAVKYGKVDIIKWMLNTKGPIDDVPSFIIEPKILLKCAGEYGNIEIIKTILEKYPFIDEVIYGAIINNKLDVIKWVYSANYKLNKDTFTTAITNNKLDIAMWLYDTLHIDNKPNLFLQHMHNNLTMYKWLLSKNLIKSNKALALMAVFSNETEIIKYIFDNQAELRQCIIETCINAGNINILDELLNRQESHINYTGIFQSIKTNIKKFLNNAIQYDKPATIIWLLEHIGNTMETSVDLYYAVDNGNIQLIKLLCNNLAVSCDIVTVSAAVKHDIKIIKFLVNRFPGILQYELSFDLINKINTKTLKFMIKNFKKCSINTRIYNDAIVHGDMELMYLINKICNGDPQYVLNTTAVAKSAYHGHLEMLKYITNNNLMISFTSVILEGAIYGKHRDIIEQLCNNAELTQISLFNTFATNDLEFIKYIHNKFHITTITSTMINNIIQKNSFEVFKWVSDTFNPHYNKHMLMFAIELHKHRIAKHIANYILRN